jgi:hypothetical protein
MSSIELPQGVSSGALQQGNTCPTERDSCRRWGTACLFLRYTPLSDLSTAFPIMIQWVAGPRGALDASHWWRARGQRRLRMADTVEMPVYALANLFLAHLVADQQGCLDSEQTNSAATQVAHSCGNGRRNRTARALPRSAHAARKPPGFAEPAYFLLNESHYPGQR